jgi:SAM-dependent methyltransferase
MARDACIVDDGVLSPGYIPRVTDYRARVYDRYSSARHEQLAPESFGQAKSGAPYLRRLIAQHFPADRSARVLDLGCGHGTLLHFAQLAGYTNLEGVDRSPEQVEAAHRLGLRNVREGDVMQELRDHPDDSLDVVIAFDLIEHFRRDELLELVDEVRRVLRPGGRWIIHTPNAESPFFGRIRYGDLTHEEAFTRTSIGQLLLSSGFADVKSYEDRPVVHGVKSAMRAAAWRVIRSALAIYLTAESGSAGGALFSQNFLTVATK